MQGQLLMVCLWMLTVTPSVFCHPQGGEPFSMTRALDKRQLPVLPTPTTNFIRNGFADDNIFRQNTNLRFASPLLNFQNQALLQNGLNNQFAVPGNLINQNLVSGGFFNLQNPGLVQGSLNNQGILPGRHTISTINNPVAFGVPQAVPFQVTRQFAVPIRVPVPVDVPRPVGVAVPQPVAVDVPRAVPVGVPRAVGVSVPQPVGVPITQTIGVPFPVPVGVQSAQGLNLQPLVALQNLLGQNPQFTQQFFPDTGLLQGLQGVQGVAANQVIG